ncbi:MAG: molybdopterin-guanine dinucleotide biosynthesis protein B [ANME-2 cluster archaeon]|nr:molybdopterin-guanine dinucleotide biosynthesis protein B [ANME-2 cluster archaeon]MDF1531271.1 molybdopterin-guanine dinucleotide biosynthesis protein B [ANME-2 cluster archaeon]
MSSNLQPRICIVGPSGSGKTTLIEKLIHSLTEKKYSVGTIKHHSHDDFEVDHEGKDTWRHAQAGARTVCISSPTMFALVKRVEQELTLDEIARHLDDRDVILADGFNRSEWPRVIIARDEADIDIFGKGKEVIATIKDPSDARQVEDIVHAIENLIYRSET